jgi:hypothetical protein
MQNKKQKMQRLIRICLNKSRQNDYSLDMPRERIYNREVSAMSKGTIIITKILQCLHYSYFYLLPCLQASSCLEQLATTLP